MQLQREAEQGHALDDFATLCDTLRSDVVQLETQCVSSHVPRTSALADHAICPTGSRRSLARLPTTSAGSPSSSSIWPCASPSRTTRTSSTTLLPASPLARLPGRRQPSMRMRCRRTSPPLSTLARPLSSSSRPSRVSLPTPSAKQTLPLPPSPHSISSLTTFAPRRLCSASTSRQRRQRPRVTSRPLQQLEQRLRLRRSVSPRSRLLRSLCRAGLRSSTRSSQRRRRLTPRRSLTPALSTSTWRG